MSAAEDTGPWRESSFLPYEAALTCPAGRVLVLAPHPDDEVFGCGGAILRHADAGDPIRVVIATDSAYGRFVAGEDGVHARRRESVEAAKLLGYGKPVYWGLPDRGLVYDERLIQRVQDAVVEQEANIVYAPSWWEFHPDHQVLALAAVEALRRCPRPAPLAMYEVGVPLHPNRLLDITDLAERKQKAMACFASQLCLQRYDIQIAALNQYRTYTLPAHVQAAEAYRVVQPEELSQDPLRAIRPGLYYGQRGAPVEPMPPLVSVLVLCSDRKALADALDSAMLQTYPHIEILTLAAREGNRTDLSPWSEGPFAVRMIEFDVASSSRAARANLAMEHARGDYLIFVADGEHLYPPHVTTLMRALQRSSPARCVYAGVESALVVSGKLDETVNGTVGHGPTDLWDLRALTPNAVLFERTLFVDGCRFDEHLEWEPAVWDFWIQLSVRTPFLPVDRVSARHKVFGDEDSIDADMIGADVAQVADVIDKWCIAYDAREWAKILLRREALLVEAAHGTNPLRRKIDKLEVSIKQRDATVLGLRKELDEQAVAREVQERALGETESRYRDADARATHADALRLESHKRVTLLESSVSWRVTRPLRALANMLRRCVRQTRR